MIIRFLKQALCLVVGYFIITNHAFTLETESNNTAFTLNAETITQGQLVVGKIDSNSTIKMNGKELSLTPQGVFVFGVGRDETGDIELAVKSADLNIAFHHYKIIPRQWKIERIDGLPPSKVNPRSEKLLNRIRRDGVLVKKARSNQSNQNNFSKPFIKPAIGRISGVYGSQRILNGVKKRPHYGEDIANKVGTPVIAPSAGIVTLAEKDLFFSGGTIIIDHGYGVTTTYLHLSQINVKVGQIINQKQKIGEIGSTGRATGPHLDWRLNWNTTRLDPGLLVKD